MFQVIYQLFYTMNAERKVKSTQLVLTMYSLITEQALIACMDQTHRKAKMKGGDSPDPQCCHRCSSSCLMLWLLPSPPGS